jgi:hypothetical protein
MTLNGVGEPAPTRLQAAVQAAKIELYTQWQTYRNGVHMDSDTFNSIDFETLVLAAIMGAGISVADIDMNTPPTTWVRKVGESNDIKQRQSEVAFKRAVRETKPSPSAKVEQRVQEEATREDEARRAYGLSADAIAEHGKQVQG